MTPTRALGARVCAIEVVVVICILVPSILVSFYGNKHVKVTCEYRDPRIRWTDRCPLPVLALSLMFGSWACILPLMGFFKWTFPSFGVYLTGADGAVATLVAIALCGYMAWGTYRLKMCAWWLSLILIVLWHVSLGITYSCASTTEMWMNMGFTREMIEATDSPGDQSHWLVTTAVWAITGIAVLAYTRRFYIQSPPGSSMGKPGIPNGHGAQ